MKRPIAITAVLMVSVAGCDLGSSEAGPGVLVSDSSGVAVIETSPDPSDPSTWQLGEVPALSLGSEVEGAPELFGRVTQAFFAPDGSLWVSDVLSAEVRVFEVPSGEHLFTVGGRGEGPGEFQMPVPLGFDESQAWIWDQNLGRLSRFQVDGELVDVRVVGRDEEITPRLLSRTRRGSFITQLPRSLTTPVSDGMSVRDTLRLWEFEEEVSDARLLVTRPATMWHFVERTQVAVPFTDWGRFAVRDQWVVVTDPDGFPSFDLLEAGELVRRVRVDRERVRVTSSDVESALQAQTPLVQESAGRMPLPEFKPTWQWVRIGSGGWVFALRYGGLFDLEVWDVFDPEGQLIGSLSLPPSSHLLDVGGEYLVIVAQPEADGPRVSVYPLPDWEG